MWDPGLSTMCSMQLHNRPVGSLVLYYSWLKCHGPNLFMLTHRSTSMYFLPVLVYWASKIELDMHSAHSLLWTDEPAPAILTDLFYKTCRQQALEALPSTKESGISELGFQWLHILQIHCLKWDLQLSSPEQSRSDRNQPFCSHSFSPMIGRNHTQNTIGTNCVGEEFAPSHPAQTTFRFLTCLIHLSLFPL